MVNKNVLSCLLKDGKEVNAVMLVGRLFHARATVTRNDRSSMVLSRVRGTIRRGQETYRFVFHVLWRPVKQHQTSILLLCPHFFTVTYLLVHTVRVRYRVQKPISVSDHACTARKHDRQ